MAAANMASVMEGFQRFLEEVEIDPEMDTTLQQDDNYEDDLDNPPANDLKNETELDQDVDITDNLDEDFVSDANSDNLLSQDKEYDDDQEELPPIDDISDYRESEKLLINSEEETMDEALEDALIEAGEIEEIMGSDSPEEGILNGDTSAAEASLEEAFSILDLF